MIDHRTMVKMRFSAKHPGYNVVLIQGKDWWEALRRFGLIPFAFLSRYEMVGYVSRSHLPIMRELCRSLIVATEVEERCS